MRRTAVILLFTAALASSFPGPSGAAPASRPKASKPAPTHLDARLYLSWNAPYGSPRAKSAIEAPCGDTTRVDTLYLSFDPGRDAPEFRGVTTTLYLKPADGRALPEFWKRSNLGRPEVWKRGPRGLAGTPLSVDFGSDPEQGFETVWATTSIGAPGYDFTNTSGRLQLLYANGAGSGPVLRGGKIYGVARVMVRRAPESSDGCGAPMCVEWFACRLDYGPRDSHDVNRGERHVSINSPDGGVCRSSGGVSGPKPWSPGAK